VVLNIHEHVSESARYFYPSRADRAIMRWVVSNLFPRADRIVVVANELKRDLVERFSVPAELIDVVYNGHDLARIRERGTVDVEHPWFDSRRRPGTYVIVGVGRLVYLKGYDLLLHALAK